MLSETTALLLLNPTRTKIFQNTYDVRVVGIGLAGRINHLDYIFH